MDWWIVEAMDELQKRVPGMTEEHAADLADDLHTVCAFDAPEVAVTKFFAAFGENWGFKPPQTAQPSPGH